MDNSRGSSCYPEDVNKLRMTVWGIAAFVFFACALLLLSGFCLANLDSDDKYFKFKQSEWQYISTQMGACMDTHAYVTYLFVLAMVVHILLLFDLLLYCMQVIAIEESRCRVCGFDITRKQLAMWSGLLLINFVIYLAGVAQFQSNAKNLEQFLHYTSAVFCLVSFWAIHCIICLYLTKFTFAPDSTYVSWTNGYFILTAIFFVLWMVQTSAAIAVEWLILAFGIALQIWAEYSLYAHARMTYILDVYSLDDTNKQSNKQSQIYVQPQCFSKLDILRVCQWVLFNFVFTFVLSLFVAPPWFISNIRKEKNLLTTPEYWTLITATSVMVAWRLCSALFSCPIQKTAQFQRANKAPVAIAFQCQ